MAERTNAERSWQTARQDESQGRRETGDASGGEAYREGSFGGGYQPSSYEQPGGRGGWPSAGPSDSVEGGYYGPSERGGYGRPPGYRYQGPGYGASSRYNAELEGGEWVRPGGEFRPGSYGPRGREPAGQRGGAWAGPWRGGEGGGFGGERGAFSGLGGWRSEGPWEQDRDFGEEGGWGGGAGFRGAYGGGFAGQARGAGALARWQGGEGSWRGGGAPGYALGGWGRGAYGEGRAPEWVWQAGHSPGGFGAEGGWGSEHGRGLTGGAGYGEPWDVPGPFAGRGPEGYQRSGDAIRDDVCERLTRHGHIDATRIRVRIDNINEVVLEGAVPDRRTKRLAEDVAESVSGVRDVQNRLRLSERDEGRSTGTGVRAEERDNRETRAPAQGARGAGHGSDETRTGRAERDAEKQKPTARARS